MDALITNVAAKAGIDEAAARSAIGTILSLFASEAPADKVNEMMNAMPGARELAAEAPAQADADDSSGGFGGGIGGLIAGALGGTNPLMKTLGELQAQGLSIDQARIVGQEVAAHAREQGGDDLVNEIAASVPGLSQVL